MEKALLDIKFREAYLGRIEHVELRLKLFLLPERRLLLGAELLLNHLQARFAHESRAGTQSLAHSASSWAAPRGHCAHCVQTELDDD